jgi:acyl dehydratase
MKVAIGDSVAYERLVTAEAVAEFVTLSGDDYAAHTDEAVMAKSSFGQRIAHGALLVAYMSAASTQLIYLVQAKGDDTTPVSMGYDRIRFLAPVFFGDRVRVDYTVTERDDARNRTLADIVVSKSDGTQVAIATHVMKWLAQ